MLQSDREAEKVGLPYFSGSFKFCRDQIALSFLSVPNNNQRMLFAFDDIISKVVVVSQIFSYQLVQGHLSSFHHRPVANR